MTTHDDDTCPHLVLANLLEAENARLKAEVERLTKEKGEFKEMTYIKGWAGIDKDETSQGIEILKQLKAKQGGQP